jgi:coronin-1B/1C/6
MSKFVRTSKYRHVFAATPKRDQVYEGVKLTKQAWDSNFVIANPKWIAIAWQVAGGGAVGTFAVGSYGRHDTVPLFTGHKGPVLDLDFNPFNDNIFATASEDCFSKIWVIPEGGIKENVEESAQTLKGHKRKVGSIRFNPVAENVLATAGQDYDIKIWDISSGDAKSTTSGHGGIIQSMEWNYDGSRLVTYCKDKKLRIVDPRSSSIAAEADSHEGVKGGRAIYMGKRDLIFSVGFGKGAQREYAVWDPKNLSQPLLPYVSVDNSAGVIAPFYDEDSDLIFLAGKGDGNVRFYEVIPEEEPKKMIVYCSQYSSNDSGAAYGAAPKRACDVNANEIMRIYKVTGTQCQPLQFTVPRKSELFQDDIFPPCRSDEPALSGDAWFGGENATPKTKSLEGGFVARAPQQTEFTKKTEEKKEMSEAELRKAYDELVKRVAYLEAELAKANAKH